MKHKSLELSKIHSFIIDSQIELIHERIYLTNNLYEFQNQEITKKNILYDYRHLWKKKS